ncbi:C-terminal binding protein [Dorea sp. D27]|uniref:C-terminal binding protein n=1 Tax=Dorea sp. D27 TaxID=658665 RepID=UPI0006733727|nr:C-terminal binding protein [Dorea sp. D27]KMZ52984.1 D-3-phosphoglycerate dehydrogenase [Dorea sp. D27]
MMKIVIADYYYPDLKEEYKVFDRLEEVEVVDLTKIAEGGIKDPAALIPYVKDADALIVQFATIDKSVIDSMERCKVIARYAIGVDTIDVEAAGAKGIYVANVPDYCIGEVADTAIAHIMNAQRKIALANRLLLAKEFDMDKIRPVRRMENEVLCLIGFGHIARNVAGKMKAFFKEIVVYDPYVKDCASYPEFRFLSFEEAVSGADVISLHVPLNGSTAHMLSDGAFHMMKDGVAVINTARGGLIDEAALIKALDSGKVGYCGLDVAATEDFAHSPLLSMEHVLLTPHMGWCSEEAIVELQRKTAENVAETLLNGKPRYCVNKI